MSIYDLSYDFARSAASERGFCEDRTGYGGSEALFNGRYRHWRGRSGKSYVFSVYAPWDCPSYENAVLIVAARRGGVLTCVDLGAFPEQRLLKLRRRFQGRLDDLEFQIHVLAEREGERLTLIDDLAPLTP